MQQVLGALQIWVNPLATSDALGGGVAVFTMFAEDKTLSDAGALGL